jgi:membrane protease YdiL (CAAX protease family)
MKLFKNEQGEVKLIWKVMLLIGGFFIVTILLKEVLVWLAANGYIHQSISSSSEARNFMDESMLGGNLLAVLEGILWFVLAWILVSVIEKRPFKSQLTGFKWNKSSIWMIVAGIVLAAIYVYLAIGIDIFFLGGNTEEVMIQITGSTGIVFFTIISALILAFSQELIFRSYLQDILIDKFGVGGGVVLTAVLFVFCSVIFRMLPIIELLSGFFLYLIIGYIYYRVRSLYLVGVLHTMLILFPSLLNISAPAEERFLTSVLFMIIGFYYFNRKDEKKKVVSHSAQST